MSTKYNHYAQELDEIAKAAFERYKAAERNLKNARKKVADNPPRWGMDAATVAKLAAYKAELETATDEERRARWDLDNEITKMEKVRNALRAEIDTNTVIKPEELDHNMMELLKAGVLNESDFRYHLESPDTTPSMRRVLCEYAKKTAQEIADRDGVDAAFQLRSSIYKAEEKTETDKLETFDKLVHAYEVTAHNPGMIDSWTSITADTIEEF